MRYFLAIDLGASSGRHMLGHIENERLVLEEMHRFPNGFVKRDGRMVWQLDRLWNEIVTGMRKCADAGKIPDSVSIDTWGVDYILMGPDGDMVDAPVSYRDHRTNGIEEEVYRLIGEQELYSRTGIQRQTFNTIFQLMAVKKTNPRLLENAADLFMFPDYLHYRLCGVKQTEYTIASTSGLLNPFTRDWDYDLIKRCGYPCRIFQKINPPSTVLGRLSKAVQEQVGYGCSVAVPASHDTGSAVMALPSPSDEVLYISSGTWSLMGTLRPEPDCSEQSRLHNFTNEGGYGNIRFQKNIMGLWMIQCVKKELHDEYSFAQLCKLAASEEIASLLDCNDQRFLSPESMTLEIQAACAETGQQVPQTPGEIAAVVYNSLAHLYAATAEEIEALTGRKYDEIYIVGGGANAGYLNELTARSTGRTVYAGPTEATAIGNVLAQMIALGDLPDLAAGHSIVKNSFDVKKFNI
jgi:rhamnulokinase